MNNKLLFDDASDLYARARPRYPRSLYDWIASICKTRKAAWDVGCGNGQAAVDLGRYFDAVEATDVSESQIASAYKADRVRYSVQSAEETLFPDAAFDAVCVAQALHWFDYGRFWPEVLRVLKRDGIVAAWGYCWPQISPGIDHVLEKWLLNVIKPYWPEQNKLLWNAYRDIPFPLARIKTPHIALCMNWSTGELFDYLQTWSATRRCTEAIGGDYLRVCFEKVRNVWENRDKRPVSMDLVLIAGRKT